MIAKQEHLDAVFTVLLWWNVIIIALISFVVMYEGYRTRKKLSRIEKFLDDLREDISKGKSIDALREEIKALKA